MGLSSEKTPAQRKVLVLRLSSLGDILLVAPVLRNIKTEWPGCHIAVLVKRRFVAALEGNPHADEIIPFDGLFSALTRIRSANFTHFLDLHRNLRSAILRRLSGIAEISVYRKDAWARRLFVFLGLRSPHLEKHVLERYLEALAAWRIPIRETRLALEDYAAGKTGAGLEKDDANFLVIQSAFLGDALLTLPLADELKRRFPRSRLHVLTLEKTADIFRAHPSIDEVLIDDKRGKTRGPIGLRGLARELERRRFDIALIPHRSFRSALLARLARIPRRIGFDSSAGRGLLTDEVPWTWLMPDAERNLALLNPLGPGAQEVKRTAVDSIFLRPDIAEKEKMIRALEKIGVKSDQILVGLQPGAAWPTKRWPEERFAALCRRFFEEGMVPILVGGAQDVEICGRIAAQGAATASRLGPVDFSGKTNLKELKALLSLFSLFVTNDSGPMHMAAGLGVPTLAIFGPTSRELGFFPYGPSHRVIEADLPCRPCRLHGGNKCPHGHFLCMRLIQVDEVWTNAMEMLSQKTLKLKTAAAAAP